MFESLHSAWLRWTALFRRRRLDRDLDDEVAFHLAMREQRLRDEGSLDPRSAARRRFGNPTATREDVRSLWQFAWLEILAQDLRYGLRTLRRAPAFAAVAVLSLALGLGANLACFTVVDALLLKNLPVRDPARLVEIARSDGANVHTAAIWREVRRLQQPSTASEQAVFSGVFAYGQTALDFNDGGALRQLSGVLVSGGYFPTLGISTVLGRALDDGDDRRGAAPVCVISYGFWQRQYGSDVAVLGRTLELDGHPFEIVGVAPRRVYGVDVGESFDVMLPLALEPVLHPEQPWLDAPQRWWLSVAGRLQPGVSVNQASARMNALAPAILEAAIPAGADLQDWQRVLRLRFAVRAIPAGASYMRELYREPLLLLTLLVGVVLLAACANVATLLAARSSARQREIATRLALGASRSRLVRQLLTESLLLTLPGALPALLFARWGGALLVSSLSSSYSRYVLDLSWDGRLWAVSSALIVFSTAVFALAPALRAADLHSFTLMKFAAASSQPRSSGRGAVIAQIALSMLLLVAGGLFLRTLQQLLAQDPGYQPEGVLRVRASLAARDTAAVGEQLLAAFRSLPGVTSAARTAPAVPPFTSLPTLLLDRPDGRELRARSIFMDVSPQYFATLRNPLLAGRDFDPRDTSASPAVAILDQTAARAFFPAADAVGQSFRLVSADGAQRLRVEVVGVAANARFGRPDQQPPPIIYRPVAQDPRAPLGTFALRFTGPLAALTARTKSVAQVIDPRVAVEFTLETDDVKEVLQRERLTAGAAGAFGALALLMASIGLYGVMTCTVARRTAEIGIRMALGAPRRAVIAMVLGDSLRMVVLGIAFGVPAAFFVGRLARGMLFGVTAADPVSFLIAGVLLFMVGLCTALLPARRAARVDPMVALRYE